LNPAEVTKNKGLQKCNPFLVYQIVYRFNPYLLFFTQFVPQLVIF